jgi:hypothetical protein
MFLLYMRLNGFIRIVWLALAMGLPTGALKAETRAEHSPIQWSELSSCETDRDLIQRFQQEFEFLLAAVEIYQSESRENPKQFRRGRSRQQLCEELLEPLVSETIFFDNFLGYTERLLRDGYEPAESGDLSAESITQLSQMIQSAFWNENAPLYLRNISEFCLNYPSGALPPRDRREFLENFNRWVEHYIDYGPTLINDLGSLQEQLRLNEEPRADSL